MPARTLMTPLVASRSAVTKPVSAPLWYDLANRLPEAWLPFNGPDVFTYDPASRLLTATSTRYNNTVTRDYFTTACWN